MDQFYFYASDLPRILYKEGISILYSTYQAGRLIFISSPNGESLVQYAKTFKRPMGVAFSDDGSKLAVASSHMIDIFGTTPELAYSYPEKKNHYDKLYIPQARYYTGYVDTHEIAYGKEGLWTINTKFSALTLMDEARHFVPKWTPPFISELAPEDRCHLNGLAMKDGKPKFVSMFSQTDSKDEWKSLPKNQGLIMDIETDEVLVRDLTMPHSPVFFDDKIYFLQSGTGQIMSYDLSTKELKEIAVMKSFLRGLEVIGDYLFVGASMLREKSTSSFGQLPISNEQTFCGLYIFNRHTGKMYGGISYTDHIKEIFSVKILPNTKLPGLLSERDEYHDKCFMAEKANFWVERTSTENQDS